MSAEVVGRGAGTEARAYSSAAGDGGLRLELPMLVRDPGAGALARTAARHCLRAWAADGAVIDAALQVIAELVANVYEHTGSELAALVIWRFPDCVRIEVSDFGEPTLEGTFPLLSVADDGDESRRGLALVNSFASTWGSRPNGERGLVRFAEIPLWT